MKLDLEPAKPLCVVLAFWMFLGCVPESKAADPGVDERGAIGGASLLGVASADAGAATGGTGLSAPRVRQPPNAVLDYVAATLRGPWSHPLKPFLLAGGLAYSAVVITTAHTPFGFVAGAVGALVAYSIHERMQDQAQAEEQLAQRPYPPRQPWEGPSTYAGEAESSRRVPSRD